MAEQSQLDTTLGQMTQIIHLAEGQSIFGYALVVFITFVIGKFISSYAKGFVTRTIATLFGLVLISDSLRIAGITITSGLILGVGFITPHIIYFFNYFLVTFFHVQRFTINTYYIFITIWYKIIRFINWIKSFFLKRKESKFGSTDNTKKSSHHRKKDSYSQHSRKQESKDSTYDDEAYQDYAKQNYKQEYEKQHSSSEGANNNTHSSSAENSTDELEDRLKHDPQYAQFFSNSYAVVLGVNSNMEFKEIKKRYRSLMRKHHPDLNPENEEVCTYIAKRLNKAYEYFEKLNTTTTS